MFLFWEISKSFYGENYGVGCPGGVEVVAHSLRDTLRKQDSDLALLKIDFKNAFNLLERDTFVKASSARFTPEPTKMRVVLAKRAAR